MEIFPFSNAPKPTLLVGRQPFDALCWLLLRNSHSFSQFVVEPSDECLKHSSYTRVCSSFSRLFYRNFIVFFLVRSLIFVSGVVTGSLERKEQLLEAVLDQ